jgi:hypothetical protein
MNETPSKSLFPSPAQELLLRAALSHGEESGDYYRRWLELVPFDGHHDEGSYRLLPLVWTNLSRTGKDYPNLGRLKGIFRNNWVKNLRRLAMAGDLLRALRSENIPTLVGKGLPLAIDFYDVPAHRPMSDFDLIVHPADAPRVSRLLEQRGFETRRTHWSSERRLRHALQHSHAEDGEVDLHWHILTDCQNDEADKNFWDNSVPIEIGGIETRRPSATDMLLHVVIHGIRPNEMPPIRWIPDAVMIIRSGETIDWDRLAQFALDHAISARMKLGLDYLKDRLGVDIPAHVLARLGAKPSLLERIELRAMERETAQYSWRQIRRGTHLVRLMQSDDSPWTFPLALAQELHKRLWAPTSPAPSHGR